MSQKEHIFEVTDHAIVRYIERYLGIDVSVIRDDIASRIVQHSGLDSLDLYKGRLPMGDGINAVFKDGKIVTITITGKEKWEREHAIKITRQLATMPKNAK